MEVRCRQFCRAQSFLSVLLIMIENEIAVCQVKVISHILHTSLGIKWSYRLLKMTQFFIKVNMNKQPILIFLSFPFWCIKNCIILINYTDADKLNKYLGLREVITVCMCVRVHVLCVSHGALFWNGLIFLLLRANPTLFLKANGASEDMKSSDTKIAFWQM